MSGLAYHKDQHQYEAGGIGALVPAEEEAGTQDFTQLPESELAEDVQQVQQVEEVEEFEEVAEAFDLPGVLEQHLKDSGVGVSEFTSALRVVATPVATKSPATEKKVRSCP